MCVNVPKTALMEHLDDSPRARIPEPFICHRD